MTRNRIIFAAGGLLIFCFFFLFVVDQTEQAIVTEFKKPVEVIKTPGLKIKMPWQTVTYYDKRVLDYDAPVQTVIAGDQKRWK